MSISESELWLLNNRAHNEQVKLIEVDLDPVYLSDVLDLYSEKLIARAEQAESDLAKCREEKKAQMVAKHRLVKYMCWVAVEMCLKPDDSTLDIINDALEMNGISGFESHESLDHLWQEVENEKAKAEEKEA